MVRIEYMPLAALKANPRNPKSHDVGAIQASVGRFGFRDAVILDERTGQILSGHGRVETLARMAADGSSPPGGVEVVDGQWSVPVQRGWASASDAEADAFVIAINRTTQLGGWDEEKLERLLVDLAAQSALAGTGYDGDDVDRIINEALKAEPERYTKKIEAPIYTPKGEQPEVSDLVDASKAEQLKKRIEAVDMPQPVREFLLCAADRHTRFHFGKIAEFYCHATPEVQRLFEDSALVIVDFDAAIESGFVRLTERLGQIADTEGFTASDPNA